ncbi:MAG: CoA transferase [Actinomycetota bacterium]|nr:CoA transferase [Actinomycetota bacterium]
MTGPLADVRVLDLTSVVMGPLATQILGDLGADVISVEDIGGDTNRFMGPGPHAQLSGVSLNLLRNKRNISLDLKHADGREAFLRLAERADIVVTNLRPGPLGRLGLAYDDVRARNARVIFCQAQGWPTEGEHGNRPAYDDVIQSAAGLADAFLHRDGVPAIAPTIAADKVSGLTIVYSVLAALHHRDRTGEGQRLEVPMVEAMQAFMLAEHGSAAIPVPAMGPAGYTRVLSPNRRPQQTADGWIHLLPYSKANYVALFIAGGKAELADDPRLQNRFTRAQAADSLYGEVVDVLRQRTTAEWLEFCDTHDIPAGPVATLDDLVAALPTAEHPLVGEYHVIPSGVRFDRTPTSVRRHAPLIGQDGDEVLLEAGYTDVEVAALRECGALRSKP